MGSDSLAGGEGYVEIREPRGNLFSFVWGLLLPALLRSWTQEQFQEWAQAGNGMGTFLKLEI